MIQSAGLLEPGPLTKQHVFIAVIGSHRWELDLLERCVKEWEEKIWHRGTSGVRAAPIGQQKHIVQCNGSQECVSMLKIDLHQCGEELKTTHPWWLTSFWSHLGCGLCSGFYSTSPVFTLVSHLQQCSRLGCDLFTFVHYLPILSLLREVHGFPFTYCLYHQLTPLKSHIGAKSFAQRIKLPEKHNRAIKSVDVQFWWTSFNRLTVFWWYFGDTIYKHLIVLKLKYWSSTRMH